MVFFELAVDREVAGIIVGIHMDNALIIYRDCM